MDLQTPLTVTPIFQVRQQELELQHSQQIEWFAQVMGWHFAWRRRKQAMALGSSQCGSTAQSPVWDPIGNPQQNADLGSMGIWWSILNDNSKIDEGHKLHTCKLIDNSLVDAILHFPNIEKSAFL